LKTCELCGIENPDEARFCMKCGKDLDKVKSSDVPEEMLSGSDTFTPVDDDEFARLAPTRRITREPVGDVASYKEAAAAAAAAWEAEEEQANLQEQAASQKQADAAAQAAPAPQPGQPPASVQPQQPAAEASEIHQTGVTADFKDQKQFCYRCGMANPRDQRFCKNCGSALAGAPGGIADQTFDAALTMSLPGVPVETTMLADVSPASVYSTADAAVEGRARERRSSGSLADWGAREWLGLIVATLIAAVGIWFAFFGGYALLFNAGSNNIHKAGATMEKLTSFAFGISATFETQQGKSPGGGHVMFLSPDRSAWEISRSGPGPAAIQGTVQVAEKTFSGPGGAWQPADPATATGNVLLLWKTFKNVETLPNTPMGASPVCLHYKYRMDPRLFMTVLGLGNQDVVSDAVMEVWIDKTSFQVIRETAQVFNAQVNGERTSVVLVMDLNETGKPYQINPPI
jgi:ribosomal protein L40E